ncbi:hypothetical protein Q1695_000462 [Nippostrongylus brasiliensis]|nr:hypothetical protein Q1695_000462 [Nippostrongylus brasiliensis]
MEGVDSLLAKCTESRWSLKEDSELCSVLEKYHKQCCGQVDELSKELSKVARLSAALDSGLGSLNSIITHIANSRFIEQRLEEDDSSNIPPAETLNDSCGGRADTVATLDRAIRKGVAATNSFRNVNAMCSTLPVIGSVEFKGASSCVPDTSAKEPANSSVYHYEENEVARTPILPPSNTVPPPLTNNAEKSVTPNLDFKGITNDSASISDEEIPSRNSLLSDPLPRPIIPKAERQGLLSENIAGQRTSENEVLPSSSILRKESIVNHREGENKILRSPSMLTKESGLSQRESENEILAKPSMPAKDSSILGSSPVLSDKGLEQTDRNMGSAPTTVLPPTETKKTSILDQIKIEPRSDSSTVITRGATIEGNKVEKTPQQPILKPDKPNSSTIQSISKKYASIFDSDSDDEPLFTHVSRPVPRATVDLNDRISALEKNNSWRDTASASAEAGNPSCDELSRCSDLEAKIQGIDDLIEDSMKKSPFPRRQQDANFLKALNEKLNKGPPVIRPKVEDSETEKSKPPSDDAKKVVANNKISAVKTEEPQNIWPLPSIAKTRARGPARRPPTQRNRQNLSGSGEGPSLSEKSQSSATPASGLPSISPVKENTEPVKRNVNKEAENVTEVKRGSSLPSKQEDKVKTVGGSTQTQTSRGTRSFFDSESDDDEPENGNVGRSSTVASTANDKKSTVVPALREKAPEEPTKRAAQPIQQKAAAEPTTKSRLVRSLFDDDDGDDDLSMFRSKPKN